MNSEIFLDNSSTTKPYDEVIDLMGYISKEVYGNPSSLHRKGIEAEREVKKSRQIISDSLRVNLNEIYFTSGGTESNNLAIMGYLYGNQRKGKHIITTSVEHPSVMEVYEYLKSTGYTVDYLNVDSNGMVNLDELKSKITNETALISIILVNNEVGAIQPINEIIKIKDSINKNTVIHVDAVQAFGKIDIFPKSAGIDMMSMSSHKIHGPKGVGALYVNKSIKLNSMILGGGQESLLRSGTENVPGICGFGKAAEITFSKLKENYKLVEALKNTLVKELNNNIEDYRIISPDESIPYILNIAFGGIKSEVLLHHLEEKNIYISTGSACSSRKKIHSRVLKAMGIPPKYIDGAIRISFSSYNTEEQIITTVNSLKEILPRIRKTSAQRSCK
ncbi:cysteine desulfurase family protein [Pseudobacteroides cellulosolvens]|uniref:Cysteine desulfurase n=1 Tax=Pseudobacteroides cellulosolvens ATCC 35603 = DSM 2933 TaxID=398512 RepID=A0A0L6JJ97_9FIRM|nr:cysteine desulfurase family protein [Pseudobacteroides cellulosolvens]KNY25753.1 Cysteine desulfurase [Pseudobacteroides cellulosolvens ATCC 35603 = DSM 2933]